MADQQSGSDFSLTPATFHILLALADGERHGYAIMQAVAQETGGTMRLGPGTLYRSIRVMLAHNLIAETDERPDPTLDDERRRYYRLTDPGKHVLQTEIERLIRIVQLAQAKPLLAKPQPGGAL
ncbi:MAG: PadR family transcriptional regulator [Herpetosiphonaceae bacterium]|nr:PadR family transcriptional regulator [Herpetosiphonaceae bacterium]